MPRTSTDLQILDKADAIVRRLVQGWPEEHRDECVAAAALGAWEGLLDHDDRPGARSRENYAIDRARWAAVDELRRWMGRGEWARRARAHHSMDEPPAWLGEFEGVPAGDIAKTWHEVHPDPSRDTEAQAIAMAELHAAAALPRRLRKALSVDTDEDVARRLGCTQSRVCQIRRNARLALAGRDGTPLEGRRRRRVPAAAPSPTSLALEMADAAKGARYPGESSRSSASSLAA